MTEEQRVKRAAEVLLSLFLGLGDGPEVARSKILAALGRTFDGRLRRRDIARRAVVDGQEDWMVSTEGLFVVVAGEHGVSLYSAATQARWSCWVLEELARLLALLAAGGWRPCVTPERAKDFRVRGEGS